MEIDLYPQYSRASSEELIEIVAAPEKYQPAAVAMAREILGARGVDVEAALAQWRSEKVRPAAPQSSSLRGGSLRSLNVTVLDEPVHTVVESGVTQRWIRGLLILLALDFVARLIMTGLWVRSVIEYWEYFAEYGGGWISLAVSLATLAALGVAIPLILRRQRLGWMLCAGVYAAPLFAWVFKILYVLATTQFHVFPDFTTGDAWPLLGTTIVFTIILRWDVRSALDAAQRSDLVTPMWVAGAVMGVDVVARII